MDRGAWRATVVHGVTKSDTTKQLSLSQVYCRSGQYCPFLSFYISLSSMQPLPQADMQEMR